MRDGRGQGRERAGILGAEATIAELMQSGLRDRDHENLSTGGRMKLHAELEDGGKRLVCECVDLQPGVEINRFLLASHVEEIIEGALIAAFATSTPSVAFYIGEDDEAGETALAGALGDPAAAELETMIVRGPFRPNLKGYEDVPTLRINAETLVNVCRVLRDGAERYREDGTPDSPGTKFFQVFGNVDRPGIHELSLGTVLKRLLYEVCGGVSEGHTLQAVIVGGAHGGFYTPAELDLSLDFDSVRHTGGIIGSGVIMVLSGTDCVIDWTRQMTGLAYSDACGRCSLGREGTYQLREIVADMTVGKSRPGDLDMLREIGRAMRMGWACATCRAAPNIVLSGMDKFKEEYEAHMKRKRCRALVCAKYVTYHVLPDLCDGCGVCVEECPEDAIAGGRKKIHVIDQDSCEQCGTCYAICEDLRKAVVKAGPVKPRTPKRPIPVGSWEG